jgi:hypothetical protein
MKYLEALKKRNLSVENLPKTLQKKIQELEFQNKALKDIEDNPNEDLEESDLADIEVVKASIAELDKHIEHKVNIFDQAKYEDKLAKISLMTELKKGKKEVEVKEPELEVSEPIVTKVVAVEQAPIQSNQIGNTTPIEEVYIPTPEVVQEVVQDSVQEEPIYEQQEEDEFERKGAGNPRKMTTGLILMGVGAFFLTWGAVNFFKSRR